MPWRNCGPSWPRLSLPLSLAFPPISRSMPATSRTGSTSEGRQARDIPRRAADAQRIADMVLKFHPDFEAAYMAPPERPAFNGAAGTPRGSGGGLIAFRSQFERRPDTLDSRFRRRLFAHLPDRSQALGQWLA